MVRGLAWAGIAALVAAAGCAKKDKDAKAGQGQAKSTPTQAGAKATTDKANAPAPCSGAHADTKGRSGISWFHDDYPAALACARAVNKPLVIDLWAPWCHTCLSMKHTVLRDPGLAPQANRFVWLALDTDKDANASALTKLPIAAWPTFYVISPAKEQVEARYVGAASVKQFRAFLKQGELGFTTKAADGPTDHPSVAVLLRDAERAAVAGEWQDAATGYGKALAKAPADWPRRPDVLVSQIGALYRLKDWKRCVAFADANLDKTGTSASAGDFTYYASVCAQKSEDKDAATAMLIKAKKRLADVVTSSKSLSDDDRSDGLRILRTLHIALGEKAKARTTAVVQRKMLDSFAKHAPTPFAAMTYNWPRAEVYVYLGVPGELVADLQKSVKDLPRQYDPPYRLAWIYSKLEKYDEALAMANKALALAYGPRKARVQALVASLHTAKGDKAKHVEALAAVVKIYEGLPEGQKQPSALAQAKDALAAAQKAK